MPDPYRTIQSLAMIAAIGAMAVLPACDREPAPSGGLEPTPAQSSTPDAAAPEIAGEEATGGAELFAGLTGTVPEGWVDEPPSGTMRTAQYRVTGAGEAGDAEVTVFTNIGGGNDANIARWVGQFTSEDGTGVEPELTTFEVSGMPVTVVELSGTYTGMTPRGAPSGPQTETGFLAAIVEAPATIIHIRLVGPQETVKANRERFMAFINGLERGA